jgi:hypothetical protein
MVTDEFTSYPGAMKKTGLTAKHKTRLVSSQGYIIKRKVNNLIA